MEEKPKKNIFYTVIRVILPPIIYFLIQYGVIFAAMAFWAWQAKSLSGTDYAGYGSAGALAKHMVYSSYLTYALAAAVVCALIMSLTMEKDEKTRTWHYVREEVRAKYLYIVLMLGGASIAGNMILIRLGVTEASESFQEVQELLSGGSPYMILLSVGIIVPICEEIIYRGLVYVRLRDVMRPAWAMIISALMFAIAHGNLPQGIFAFGLGLLLAFSYERYGTLAAPCLGHISANILSSTGSLMADDPMPGFAISVAAAVIAMAAGVIIIMKRVRGGVISPKSAEIGDGI
ncbi:MAG: CPBP family intramembrane metalloprotease [Lachnospiraceae bacterium]|nr:CPBP family intramembrane metalloprotease [Lachnospiraceae bacterium]